MQIDLKHYERLGITGPCQTIQPGHRACGKQSQQLYLSDLSEKVIFWNSTLGLELLCRGRKVACIADAYYSRQGITRNIENLDMLEAYLLEDWAEMLDEREIALAFKITYVTRNRQRFTSPVHCGRLSSKFLYPTLTSRGARFERNLSDYCNGAICVTELTEGL